MQKRKQISSEYYAKELFGSMDINGGEMARVEGINIEDVLDKIKKSKDILSPIYEAITNSIEAIDDTDNANDNNQIVIILHLQNNSVSKTFYLSSIEVHDTGVGFNETNYDRIKTIYDKSKSRFNKGVGRIQFIKYFKEVEFVSRFQDSDNQKMYQRSFMLSQDKSFVKNNTILKFSNVAPLNVNDSHCASGTCVRLNSLNDKKDANKLGLLSAKDIKDSILIHYMVKFSERSSIPKIIIDIKRNESVFDRETIEQADIHRCAGRKEFIVYGKKISNKSSEKHIVFEDTSYKEQFFIQYYELPADKMPKKAEIFISKGEAVKNACLRLLKVDEIIDNKRFLIYIKGEYIDKNVTDSRASLKIKRDKDLRNEYKEYLREKQRYLFEMEDDGVITLDDIIEKGKSAGKELIPALNEKQEAQNKTIEKIKRRFYFSDDVVKHATRKIRLSDSNKTIIQKMYFVQSQEASDLCASIDTTFDEIESIDLRDSESDKKMNKLIKGGSQNL